MHPTFRVLAAALISVVTGSVALLAESYPLSAVADVTIKRGATTVTSVVTIKVDRLIDDLPRTRVMDALRFGGYGPSLNELRRLPAIGTISIPSRSVDIRWAAETKTDAGTRLVLVADRPLFFLNGPEDKPRAGYELTVVELMFDKAGNATGTMSGASKVKPAGDGNVTMTDFADSPVQLSVRKNAK